MPTQPRSFGAHTPQAWLAIAFLGVRSVVGSIQPTRISQNFDGGRALAMWRDVSGHVARADGSSF